MDKKPKSPVARYSFAERPWTHRFQRTAILVGGVALLVQVALGIHSVIVRNGYGESNFGLFVALLALVVFGICEHRILRDGLLPDPVERWTLTRGLILGIGAFAGFQSVLATIAIAAALRMHYMTWGEWPPIEGTAIKVGIWLAACLIICIASVPAAKWATVSLRRAQNHCIRCDYDLTGNQAGFCPECGLPTQPTFGGRSSNRGR